MARADHPWHALEASEVEAHLATDHRRGLQEKEAEERSVRDGPNELPRSKPRSAVLRFLDQFKAPLVVILLISAAVTIILGGVADAMVILGVVMLNAVIGFIQEGKAVRELSALNASVVTPATVIRDGVPRRVDSTELVLGDLIQLEAGDRVPADLRIVRSRDLQADESPLTGESTSVEKRATSVAPTASLADRSCMLYASTTVTYGSGYGVVVATATDTEIGQISQMMDETAALMTPLTKKIERFSTALLWGIVALAVITFAIGILRGLPVYDMVLASVALAVGAIPEGLPAAVTIILAIGVARMAKRKAIIRQLPAVETLGSTTVICSDKTGTLTQNQMTVTGVVTAASRYSVSGSGFEPVGTISTATGYDPEDSDAALTWLARAGSLCGLADVHEHDGRWEAVGDPTEAALVVLAMKVGDDRQALEARFPQLDVIPFSSDTRFMATLHANGDGRFIAMKGSVETVLSKCNTEMQGDGNLSPLQADRVLSAMADYTERGHRVLAVAVKQDAAPDAHLDTEHVEGGFSFCGMVAMIDPPRPEVREAIEQCAAAGIAVKMVTGDHVATARAIARDLGMAAPDGTLHAYSGTDLEELDEAEFHQAARDGVVFARVSPEQKLRLVQSLQEHHDNVVAMTGDGVNDAPALRRADIGVAMGISGTDVAKDAADMVLTDDNFVTIVNAVREGRIVFGNLLKFIVWSLPTNIGEGLVILTAIALGLDLPVAPVQLLWVNMTTAVILGMPLAFEAGRTDIMELAPRDPGAALLSNVYIIRTFAVGAMLLMGAFSVFSLELEMNGDLDVARTAAANCLVLMEAFYLFNCRQLTLRQRSEATGTNPYLWVGIAITLGLQVMFVYAPFMQELFHTAPVSPLSWLITAGFGVVLAVLVEIEKRIRRALHQEEY